MSGSTRRRAPAWLLALVALAALVLVIGAWQRLAGATAGLAVSSHLLGAMPVTVFRPAATAPGAAPAPVALIAHGFAGSQQLMQPLAATLARNGWVAITFDFPGHGRHPLPMRGGLSDPDASQRTLLAAMADVGGYARGLAQADGGSGRYAVLGHSMASDIVVRHAQAHAEVQATVGISLFAPSIRADTPGSSPRNLLTIAGALEPGMMATEALRVVGRVAGPQAVVGTTYGRFDDGTARRATLSPGVEHIGVLYSAHTLRESLHWLNAAFGRPPPPAEAFIDARGPALGALLLGVVALAWPLSRLLPRVRARSWTPWARRPWWRWHGQAPLTLLPALLTPLLLWRLPSDVLPIVLGDYLVLHFALYGLLTWAGLWALRRRARPGSGTTAPPTRVPALVLALLAATAWAVLAVGVPVDRFIFNVQPVAPRLPVVLVMCAGTLCWFLADEWLTRDPAAAPGAYFVSKLCFLLSLVAAIALNPGRLFFLAIIVPAILLLFILYGLFSRWAYRQTGHPAVGAVANALAFGCFIAVTFPLVR